MKQQYEKIMQDISQHKDFGKRNPVDIGIELGYSSENIEKMIEQLSISSDSEDIEDANTVEIENKEKQESHGLNIDTKIYLSPVTTYFVSNASDYFEEIAGESYKSHRKCKEVIEKYVRKCDIERQKYLDFNSEAFAGREIIDDCYNQVCNIINQLEDYLKINNIALDISEIVKIKGSIRNELEEYIKKQILAGDGFYTVESCENCINRISIEENEEFDFTIFGNTREVKVYTPGMEICDFLGDWDDEIDHYFETMALDCQIFVKEKYLDRINNFISLINAKMNKNN